MRRGKDPWRSGASPTWREARVLGSSLLPKASATVTALHSDGFFMLRLVDKEL